MNALLRGCADSRVTLLAMGALVVAVGVGTYRPGGVLPWIAAPVALLAVNLIAAVAVDARIRRRVPLLGFHLCLLAVVALGGIGNLTRFSGSVELAAGQAFDPTMVRVEEQGVWHANRLGRVAFEQSDIVVRYGPGLRRVGTESALRLPEPGAPSSRRTIGDEGPLLIEGYRFYPTSNKGFAAYLSWTAGDGVRRHGTVHFPSFPLLSNAQENRWRLPGGRELVLTLDPDFTVAEDDAWTLHGAGERPRLTVHRAGRQTVLEVGEELAVDGDVVRFEGVGLWMGYWIYSEPSMAWLFAAACLGVLLIGWHFVQALHPDARLADRPGRLTEPLR